MLRVRAGSGVLVRPQLALIPGIPWLALGMGECDLLMGKKLIHLHILLLLWLVSWSCSLGKQCGVDTGQEFLKMVSGTLGEERRGVRSGLGGRTSVELGPE